MFHVQIINGGKWATVGVYADVTDANMEYDDYIANGHSMVRIMEIN